MRKKGILFAIVTSQFLCTSLWFAGNAVATELSIHFDLDEQMIGQVTSFVQFGFIVGTLFFAVLKISDRISPSKVFMLSAFLGAFFNVSITFLETPELILTLRFMTGFCLAGIYPVGMKIASDYHRKGLGKALGYLVGALVLGTASPHLLRDFFEGVGWRYVFYSTSVFAIIGGSMVGLGVSDGPYRQNSPDVDFTSFFRVFSFRDFRSAAIGYFGHMWELYAFWAFVPVFISYYLNSHPNGLSVSFLSFLVIGVGSLGCVLGGYISFRSGSKIVAAISLIISLLACLLSPFFLQLSPGLFFTLLMIWGMTVIADSPQFSSLVAQSAPRESTGTALTIVNSLGFAITIVSIQLLSHVNDPRFMFLYLSPGPLLGLWIFWKGYRA